MSRMRSCSPPPEWSPPTSRHVETYHIKVITPMFGGGYTPGEVDADCIVRPATVRGHLRFWWRATAGARYSVLERLLEAEQRVWGLASKPGCVAISVPHHSIVAGRPKPCSQIASPRSSPREGPAEGFFVWPFQASDKAPERSARVDVAFDLQIAYAASCSQAQREEVAEAIQAWCWFGGIGSRTRRGCGAIDCERLRMQERPEISVEQTSLAAQQTVLAGAVLILGPRTKDTDSAWKSLGRFWARFRKGHWDDRGYEPMVGCRFADYRKVLERTAAGAGPVPLFKPFLGMPINYQKFANASFHGEVVPGESKRMGSPIILRPVILRDGSARPMVLCLRAPSPPSVRLGGEQARARPLLWPEHDPVVRHLKARDVTEAVIRAARIHFQNPVVTVLGANR